MAEQVRSMIEDGHPELPGKQTKPNRGRKRLWRWLIGILVAGIVVAAVLSARKRSASEQAAAAAAEEPQVATIKVVTASAGDIGLYVEALGTVTPLATVNLYSQVTGRVVAVHYAEGQMVRKGAPLIDIDPLPYEAQLKEAEGTLDKDRSVLAQAQMDLGRYKEAADQQAIARQTYDDQRMAVDQYAGTVKNDLGQVQYQRVQLGYCHLVSPIDGRIGLRLVDPGNTVFSGSTSALVVITQLQPVTVVFNVAEDDLNQVRGEITARRALPVDAFDRSQQTKLATGRLLTLDNQIDTSTGTVRFRGQFENRDLRLFPNQFVNARMLVKTLHNTILIPTAAVQRNGTQAFVYVVVGDAVKMRTVAELTTEGEVAAVTGLRAGEVVPITGFDKLQDGAKVRVEGRSQDATQGSSPRQGQRQSQGKTSATQGRGAARAPSGNGA